MRCDLANVVCGLSDGSVCRVTRARARLEWTEQVQRAGRVTKLDFNSRIVAAGGSDRSVAILDFRTGNILRYLEHRHLAAITDILLQAGSLISASHDKTVLITQLQGDSQGQSRAGARLTGELGWKGGK